MQLPNSQSILSMSDMAPFSTAVMEFTEGYNLPSFSYPEVYEFLVNQKNLKTEEFRGSLVFDYGDDFEFCSTEELDELVKTIRFLDGNKELFWQRRNKGINEASRAVRAAEHELAKAEARLADLLKGSEDIIV